MDVYDNISPLDYRYYKGNSRLFKKLSPYLSENAFIKYQLKVEAALAGALSEKGIISREAAEEIRKACQKVKPEDIYAEDKKIKHYTRAMVNCIARNVSEKTRPFIHFTATSFDIFDTANALRYKDVANDILIPELLELESNLIRIARQHRSTLQIGRTHGQHAEPITFGFAMAEYVSRIGSCIEMIKDSAKNLRGKFSGAVGAYNASSLFFPEPEGFERAVLGKLGLKPASHSTQIVEPEYLLNFFHSITACFGVLANLADDMRQLQRSEIGEVAEKFEAEQVGSSTMPHKRNPWNFEHIKSVWKTMMPRIVTVYSDQISEHQRDLTNSASSRFYPEIIAGFMDAADRMNKLVGRLVVDREALKRNFDRNREYIIAEPLYLLLSYYGHPDAHEAVRQLTLKSEKTGRPLLELFLKDSKLKEYYKRFSGSQRRVLENPEKYTGIAAEKAEGVCDYWEKALGL
jgi:adenylosuccinate lyase